MGRKFRAMISGCLLAILGILAALAVRADASGSIRLEFPAGTTGVEMTLYRVGEQSDGTLVCSGAFADSGVEIPSTENADALAKAAEQLSAYAGAVQAAGTAGTAAADGSITFTGLTDGVYLIVQTGGTDVMEVQKILLALPYLADESGNVSYAATLIPKYTMADGALLLKKTDDAGNALSGAEFSLQRKVYITEDGEVPDGAEAASDDGGRYYWKDVQTGLSTDQNGQIAVSGLAYGTYRFLETKTPEGIVSEMASAEAVLEGAGTLTQTDSGWQAASGTVAEVTVTNNRTSLIVNKVDSSDVRVSGAVLVVKDSAGNVILDEDGNAKYQISTEAEASLLRGLPAGSYYLSEVTVPDGYRKAADVAFTVSEEKNAVNAVTMVDEKVPESDNASITVTKYLEDISGNRLWAQDAVFYAALFSDEARTDRVTGVQELVFHNGASTTVTFEGLEPDTVYYVGETDAYGKLLENGTLNTKSYTPEYPDGYTVRLTGNQSTGTAEIVNTFPEFPDGFYYDGKVTITKKTMKNGSAYNTEQTFYAGIFSDEAYTELAADVVTLAMDGGSSTSVTVEIPFLADSVYYVTETDESGTPLENNENLSFDITVENGQVTLNEEQTSAEVTITNTFTEEPTATPSSEPTVTPAQPQGATPTPSSSTGVRTGDDTPIALYVLLALAAALAACAVLIRRRRKNKK